MTEAALRPSIEAILFLADAPVTVSALADALEASPPAVEAALEELRAWHDEQPSGLTVRASGGGWRLYTSEEVDDAVSRWVLAGRTGRLTQAALETLAVIAYKQPISRHAISEVRGVNAEGALRSLLARGLVIEVARGPGPGQAVLYGTTPLLLEKLGIDSLDELPPLTDFLPEEPAPDEPAPDALREARRRLAEGADLPSSWRAGERDEEPESSARRRGRSHAEIEELTASLERAAGAAMAQLRSVAAGLEEPDEPADDEPPAGATAPGADATGPGEAGARGADATVQGADATAPREAGAE